MKPAKKKRGRPRKQVGEGSFKDFKRAGMVISAYDELRRKNEKHSVAVREAAEMLKQRHPKMPVSDTGVRRILAEYRPRESRTTLLFDRSIIIEAGRERLRRMLEQVQAAQPEQGAKADVSPEMELPTPRTKYMFRFGERPTYPRHNAKETTTCAPA
jgi:hypothetical protein